MTQLDEILKHAPRRKRVDWKSPVGWIYSGFLFAWLWGFVFSGPPPISVWPFLMIVFVVAGIMAYQGFRSE